MLLTHALYALQNDVTRSSSRERIVTAPNPEDRSEQDDNDDLYAFVADNCSAPEITDNSIDREIQDYLSSKRTDRELILEFPHLRQAFIKFNASLPSSAAVERLFSSAGQILLPRRCRLSDVMFEKLVFLRHSTKGKTE